ncbi:uncharacterized protein BDZ99DRAFT_474691 [Mytilinidion resinicola]|uniref:Uncharacterized protein n=1 Tax=Mytilinidion resinicola TaxID=574789 RepID=A0A6A6YU99_9PEZI|nr:uncharacterized protein BDZ99DRAFT_474691 [Mytilinidion resinicola]KAF2812536.1 hypothetical protein BDZ99DRAFT_474691 [Mytilinidion resinicola]
MANTNTVNTCNSGTDFGPKSTAVISVPTLEAKQPGTTFLDLPSELRLQIFRYAFDPGDLVSIRRNPAVLTSNSFKNDTRFANRSLRLATICRTVSQEVVEAYYSSDALPLKVEWAEYFSQTKQLLLPPRHVRRFVRRIAFYNSTENFWHSAIGHGQGLGPLQRLDELGFTHLKSVYVVIGDGTAEIINLCFQEPRRQRSKLERLEETRQAFGGLRVRADSVSIFGLERHTEFTSELEKAVTLYR